ncbi:hypothetical protein V8E36_001740 [Tilletia maclaganii]
MRFLKVAAALVAALGLTSARPVQNVQDSHARGAACPAYTIVSTRGTDSPQKTTSPYTGMINQTLAAVPGGRLYDIVYPATLNFLSSVPDGVSALAKYIHAQLAACPSMGFVLLGYSQGAEIVDLTLHGVLPKSNATIFNAIKAVVLIGDPNHVPGNSANVDEFGGNSTSKYSGFVSNPFLPPVPQAYNKAGKLLNICKSLDMICAFTQPKADFAHHLMYEDDAGVQKLGADFIIPRLRA